MYNIEVSKMTNNTTPLINRLEELVATVNEEFRIAENDVGHRVARIQQTLVTQVAEELSEGYTPETAIAYVGRLLAGTFEYENFERRAYRTVLNALMEVINGADY